jgi:hypothetical protein
MYAKVFGIFCLWYGYFRVLCYIVVPLPPGKTPFAVQLHNNNNNNNKITPSSSLEIEITAVGDPPR